MPMSIQSLREFKAEKLEVARTLSAREDFAEEHQSEFDSIMDEIKGVDARIKNMMELDGLTDPQHAENIAGAAGYAKRSEAEAEPVYRNLGEQLQDVYAMTVDNAEAPKARERFQQVVNAASGGSTGVDSEGGYLVETDKSRTILTTAIETGVLSSRCTVQPISANADSFSYLAADDRDRSTSKRNGIDVYRKSEVSTLVSSGVAHLKERELRAEDMYGLLYVTNRMLRDAPAMAEYAKRCLREQLAFKLDSEIFEGDGVGKCLGIMNSDLPVTVGKESSQTAKTVNANNVMKMLSRFQGNIAKAAWFVNQDVLPQLPFMTIGNQPIFIPGGSFANAPYGVLLGIPIVPIEHCKTLGTKGDIVLGDFSEYLLVQKGGLEVAESIHVKFLTDEMAFRFIVRNNGQPMHDNPITPLNGTNTLSPFVLLETRS